jgi:hypothetical protein
MLHLDKIRNLENLHIVFWLIKDACWLLEFRIPGTSMVFPTVLLAVYMVVITLRHPEFFLNCAILCWITANSWWMLMEFYNDDRLKNFSVIPFALGLIAISLYYLGRGRKTGRENAVGVPGSKL